MKKSLAILLTILVVLVSFPSGMILSHGLVTFKDVPKDAWYYEHVQYVGNHPNELMVGYAGNFGPLDNLTVEQFIKITVAAAGRGVIVPPDKYWGDVYVSKGIELGFVLPGEFNDYRRAITRAEMSRIIIRSLPMITGEKDITYNENDIRSRIVDYDSIPVNLRDYVCKAYQLGILVGGADGYFRPNDSLTRASAAAVIHNMLEPGIRTVYTPPEEIWSDAEFEAYIRENAEDFYCIAKIENRKIYLRNAINTAPTLLSDKNNPIIHELLYECAKTMAYYANKNGNAFSLLYNNYGEYARLGYHIVSDIYDADIDLFIYAEPQMSYIAKKYAPGEQKYPSYYRWDIGVLYEDQYITDQGFYHGMDRSKINWVQEKYKNVLLHLCQIVYGPAQGKAFCDFVVEKITKVAVEGSKITDKYFGVLPNANIEIAYYRSYPDVMRESFWTDKPEVRK